MGIPSKSKIKIDAEDIATYGNLEELVVVAK